MKELFFKQMECELLANSHKGDFNKWRPSDEDILKKIDHHLNKLKKALLEKNKSEIREFSANIGNFSKKIYEEFGKYDYIQNVFICSKIIS